MIRAVIVAGMMSALAFAGCTDPEPPTEPVVEDPCLVSAPDDYECLQDNVTADERPHLHDYWQGQDRIVVMDAPHQDLGPGFAGASGPYPVHEYRGATDEVIPQGTRFVNVTLTWTDDMLDAYSTPQLWVKTAAEHEPQHVADITSGQPVQMEIDPVDWDLPHQRLSAWIFELRMESDPMLGFIRFKGDTNILVEAERGLDIPLFPAHPDLWGEATEIELFSDEHSLAYMHDVSDGGCNGFSCPMIHTPADGVVVPFDAARVEVTFTAAHVPTTLDVQYHGADTREWTRMSQTGAEKTYVIDLDGQADGPYAEQSLWEFTTWVSGPIADSLSFDDYSIRAVAYK